MLQYEFIMVIFLIIGEDSNLKDRKIRSSAIEDFMLCWHALSQNQRCCDHRLIINRPTKHGKEKSPSNRQCQCQKEMDEILACQQFLTESHIVTRLANE
jgi:hypothetical protein